MHHTAIVGRYQTSVVVREEVVNPRIIKGLQAPRQLMWTKPYSWEFRRES